MNNATNHDGSESAYEPPDILLGNPATRPLKIIVVGCGVSGIMMTYKIQKACQNVELCVYERNTDLGGTWYENRYPGAGCDIPAHTYTYNFALYPDWPRYCAYRDDIQEYLNKVARVFGLRKYMQFNSEVLSATWNETSAQWTIKVRQDPGKNEGNCHVFERTCDVFLYATGTFAQFKMPKLRGSDIFKGKLFHSARWPDDYQEDHWKRDRLAVIGSGASSIGIVSALQPKVKRIDIFVRTGTYFATIADNTGDYRPYSEGNLKSFRSSSQNVVSHVKDIEAQLSGCIDFQIAGSEKEKELSLFFKQRMKEHIKDDRLLAGFMPTFSFGCRRVTPADPYMRAVQQPNVYVHFAAAEELTESTIIDANGDRFEVDTVVCATGFNPEHRCRFPIIGRDGIELAAHWGDHPEAYLGLAVPNFPNFFTFMGPAWPVHNGSVMGPLTANGDYVIDVLQKMQRDHIKSLAPRAEVTAKFNEHVQSWIKRTVWTQGCHSWFKNNETNRVTALWPGTALHYREAILRPRYEDFDIEYMHNNPWAILGNGYSWAEKTEGIDATLFLSVDLIDPVWRREVWGEKV